MNYRCPACTANLIFDPSSTSLSCDYCGYKEKIPINADEIVEHALDEFANQSRSLAKLSEDALEVGCTGCGAQIIFAPPEVAGSCPFCAQKLVVQPQAQDPLIAPQGVLPFSVSKEAAKSEIRAWIKRLWFLPNAVHHLARHDDLVGIYLPHWTYDAFTRSFYVGERGDYYYTTETRSVRDSAGKFRQETYQKRHTRWTAAHGQVDRFFDDVCVPGTKTTAGSELVALEPWPLHNLSGYEPAFLSGFKAERYGILPEVGLEHAKQRMETEIRELVAADIGGDTQRIEQVDTAFSAITFKHLLFPIWMGAYRFQGKVFRVLINGQTKRLYGQRPYSIIKIAFAILVLGVILSLVAWLSGHNP